MQRMLRKFFEEEFLLENFFFQAKCIKKCTLQFISLLKISFCTQKNPDLKRCKKFTKKSVKKSLTFFFNCLIVLNAIEKYVWKRRL